MLSETEQQKLMAIESRLRSDDPFFVERFLDTSTRRQRKDRRRTVVSAALVAVLIAAVVAVAVGLVLSSVVTVVVALTTIGAVTGLWITTVHRSDP